MLILTMTIVGLINGGKCPFGYSSGQSETENLAETSAGETYLSQIVKSNVWRTSKLSVDEYKKV